MPADGGDETPGHLHDEGDRDGAEQDRPDELEAEAGAGLRRGATEPISRKPPTLVTTPRGISISLLIAP